jgi:hypothetical protein
LRVAAQRAGFNTQNRQAGRFLHAPARCSGRDKLMAAQNFAMSQSKLNQSIFL